MTNKIIFFDSRLEELKRLSNCFNDKCKYKDVEFDFIRTIINPDKFKATLIVSYDYEMNFGGPDDLINYIKHSCDKFDHIGIVIELDLAGKEVIEDSDFKYGIFLERIFNKELKDYKEKIRFLFTSRIQIPESIFNITRYDRVIFSIKPSVDKYTNNYNIHSATFNFRDIDNVPQIIKKNYEERTIYGNFVGDVLSTVLY